MDSLPRDLATERALLSALALDPRHYKRLRSRVSIDLFDNELHRAMLGVFERIHRSGLDITMRSILTEIDRDEALSQRFRATDAGLDVLTSLTNAGIPSNSAETYLKLAEEWAHKRNILRATEELAGMARNGATAADLAALFHAYSRRMEGIIAAAEDVRTVDLLAALSQALPPIPWIADGWLGAGDVVIFGGEWASGKSLIALDLAISVSTGIPWMGRVPINTTGPVLYVDEENNSRNISRRLSRMIRGRDIDPDQAATIRLRYLSKNHLRLDAPKGLETLRREMETHRPVLVVLDSLIRFHGADENSNTDVAALFGEAIVPLATQYNSAVLVLDHMRKPSKEDERFDTGHRIRGAGDKAGVGDGVWTVEGDRETDSRTLSCRKNRWEDSLPPSFTTKWVVSDDESAAWIECKDATLSAESSIPEILRGTPGGLLAKDLYSECQRHGMTLRAAKAAIKRLLRSGSIETRKDRGGGTRYWVGQLVEAEV